MEQCRSRLILFVLIVFALNFGYQASDANAANVYISDLTWISATNGWNGAPKLDKANGDPGVPLNPITLHGTVYPKGIGCHAPSVITYNLGGNYTEFVSYIGIDDEVVSGGSVDFQVWVDNVQVYDSGILTHDSTTLKVDVPNLDGKSTLQLIVNVGTTTTNDHADWAGAYLVPIAAGNGYYGVPSWNQILPANTRFIVLRNMGNAAVLDKETGLVWEQSPDGTNTYTWENAQLHCNQLTTGGRGGWRLPTVQELDSLVDPTQATPSLPSGHPFNNVQSFGYWSATTLASSTINAWGVNFNFGSVGIPYTKSSSNVYVWCVRGGHGVDPQ